MFPNNKYIPYILLYLYNHVKNFNALVLTGREIINATSLENVYNGRDITPVVRYSDVKIIFRNIENYLYNKYNF